MPVGRARELAAVDRAITATMSGAGSLLLLGGEPGIGKTTVAAEARRRADDRGMATGWGGCPPTGAPPFLPWRTAVRHVCPDAEDALASTDGGADDARFRLFEEVSEVLFAGAQAVPLVLILDDLQWADAASLHLLRFLARSLPQARVLVVGTYRDGEADASGPLATLIEDVVGAGSVLRLTGLGPAEVEALALARDVPAKDADLLHRRTGGNPFLVEQLCDIDDRHQEAPPAVARLLRRRLRDLDPDHREVLEVAAVAGSDVDVALCAAVVDRPREDVLEAIDAGVGAQVLVSSAPGFRFVHDLMREAVMAGLPAGRLAELHLRWGRALDGLPDRVEEAARHLQAGAVVAPLAETLAVTQRAADSAFASLAFEQAAAHLTWAVGALGEDAGSDLLLRLGDAELKGGSWQRAAATFERAASVARASGDAESLARAALGFGAGLGGFEVRLMDSAQISLLEEAAAALDPRPSALRAYVLARLSVALSFVGDSRRRDELTRQAVADAEEAGDPAALAYALATRADVLAGPDHVAERLSLAERVVNHGREAADDEVTLLGHRLRIVALLERGDIVALDREIVAFSALAERHRVPVVRWYVPLFAGMRALMRGELEAAERHAAEAERIGALAGSANAEMLVGTQRLAIAAYRGTIADFYDDEVVGMIEPYAERNPTMVGPWVLLAGMALAVGDRERARHAIDAAARLDFGSADRDSEWLGTLTGATEVVTALGAVEQGRRIHELLAPYAGLLVVDGIAAACLASVDDVLAQLCVLLGRADEARRHQAQGLEAYERVGMPLAAGRLRELLDAAPPAQGEGIFRREGDLWLLSYAGREVRFPDSKGLQDLHLLVRSAGRELPVSVLVGGVADGPVDVVLDDTARRAYKQRLDDLDEELDRAGRTGDARRAARATAERDALIAALAEATGLGGRRRVVNNDVERSRQAVRARIRHVLQRLEPVHPELARHLTAAVRTGARCGYLPEHEVRWQT